MLNYQGRRRSLPARRRDFALPAHDLAGMMAHLNPLVVRLNLLFGIVRGLRLIGTTTVGGIRHT